MARYNTFLYGDGTLWGQTETVGPTDPQVLWSVIVDWDNDGYFSGENEAENMIDFSLSRGRDNYINRDGLGFERYRTGRATLILDNDDGRYNPFNTSSPLWPNVVPGKRIRIAVLDRDTDTNHELMRGNIVDIQPFTQSNRKFVRVDVADGQEFLRGRTVKIGIREGNPSGVSDLWTTGQWVDLILQRAGWPDSEWPRTYDVIEDANGNQLGVGFTENFYRWLKYAWFWLRDAYESIQDMENAELGTFLHARDGSARFLSSHFTYDKVVDLDESELLRDITTPMPWETIKNRIEVRVRSIHLASVGANTPTVWSVEGDEDSTLFVAADASRTFEAEFKYDNIPCYPSDIFIDYELNSAADGGGSSLISQVRITVGEIGDGATISLNNDGPTDGYIINLSVIGIPLYSPYSSATIAEDDTSQDIYGLRSFRLESRWLQEFDWADTLKAMLLNVLKDPTQYPVIKIENRPDKQFALDLYVDAIHLTSDTLGINAFYRIGKIEHKWLNPTGEAVATTLKLEPYFALDAQAELDFDLFSPLDSSNPGFGTSLEIGCTGSAPAGRMKWCLEETIADFEGWVYVDAATDHTYGDWDTGMLNGHIRGKFDGGNEADMASQNLSYTIVEECALSLWYQWQETSGEPGSSEPVTIIMTTVESGTIISQAFPFVSTSGTTAYTQLVIDLSAYAGDTLNSIIFRKPAGFNAVDVTILRIDDIGLGKLIYAGEN